MMLTCTQCDRRFSSLYKHPLCGPCYRGTCVLCSTQYRYHAKPVQFHF